ncbi:MAG: YbaB/EbfC family nucleoid-associated protein [Pseudonocardiaceae bacterium]
MQPGGAPDMQQILQQAQMMQQQLMNAQAELAETEVTGQAGNHLVSVTLSGSGEVRSVTIDPKVVDPDDVETLQDLVVGALADANRELYELTQKKMGPLASGLGEAGGGLGLPGM